MTTASEAVGRTLRTDPWLSNLLGKPAFELDVDDPVAALEELAVVEEGLITAKVEAERVDATHALEEAGFRLVSTQVRLSATIVSATPTSVEVGFAEPDRDADGVGVVAGAAFAYSRFHTDPAINPGTADAIKREWATGFFYGRRGDYMVVARDRGEVIGFLQLLKGDGDSLLIDLIGVDEHHRGAGAAGTMIGFAATHCRPYDRIDVGTQISNEASLRLYLRLGFVPYAFEHVFHLHRG